MELIGDQFTISNMKKIIQSNNLLYKDNHPYNSNTLEDNIEKLQEELMRQKEVADVKADL